jgi:ribosomal protein L13E
MMISVLFYFIIYIACNILHVYMRATVKDGQRNGRGYSLEELKEADIDARTARKNGVPTDVWRKTKYPKNVEQLKSMAKTIKESPKDKPDKKAKKKKDEK